MAELKVKQYRWQRSMQHLPASSIGAAAFSKFLHVVDEPLMKVSNGGLSVPALVAGLPTVMLTSIGAKSGEPRRVPVIGVPDGKNVALIASNWGQKRNPGWYYNLRKNPEATLEFGGESQKFLAQEVTDPDEYARLWKRANEVYLGYDKYQARAGERKIPIMLLTPVG